jgi:hypothetical protein
MGFDQQSMHAERRKLLEEHAASPRDLEAFIDAYRRDPAAQLPTAADLAGKHVFTDEHRRALADMGADQALAEKALAAGIPGPNVVDIARTTGAAGLRELQVLAETHKVAPVTAVATIEAAHNRGVMDRLAEANADGTVARLLGAKIDPLATVDLIAKHSVENLRFLGHCAGAPSHRLLPPRSENLLRDVTSTPMEGPTRQLVESGNVLNPDALPQLVDTAYAELLDPMHPGRGAVLQLEIAADRAKQGKVSLEAFDGHKADVLMHLPDSKGEAIQSKAVTGDKNAVVTNTYAAVKQLRGETGENPPAGYKRTAHIQADTPTPDIRGMTKEQFLAALAAHPPEFRALLEQRLDGTVGWEEIRFVSDGVSISVTPADVRSFSGADR